MKMVTDFYEIMSGLEGTYKLLLILLIPYFIEVEGGIGLCAFFDVVISF